MKENKFFKNNEAIEKMKMEYCDAIISLILKEKGKIHHKTLQKINNQINNNGNINLVIILIILFMVCQYLFIICEN